MPMPPSFSLPLSLHLPLPLPLSLPFFSPFIYLQAFASLSLVANANVPTAHVRLGQPWARRDRPPRVIHGADVVLESEPRSGPPREELGVIVSPSRLLLGGQGGRVVLLGGGVVLVDEGLHRRGERGGGGRGHDDGGEKRTSMLDRTMI